MQHFTLIHCSLNTMEIFHCHLKISSIVAVKAVQDTSAERYNAVINPVATFFAGVVEAHLQDSLIRSTISQLKPDVSGAVVDIRLSGGVH
jgi:hypothetical protein